MPTRRILSLWFPRLAAERVLRRAAAPLPGPFAVVEERGNAQILAALSVEASAVGLTRGQPLRDARAMCPDLRTRLASPEAEAAFLTALRRWAGQFSPWVAKAPPDGLMADLTGCAHLFGGEAPLLGRIADDCADLGLTVQAGIADTVGAAWALARYAGQGGAGDQGQQGGRSGDAIDQEAYATRSRAAKRRHWERGGATPQGAAPRHRVTRIAPPGQSRTALGPLPVAALRLDADTAAQLIRLGLRRIEDLAGQPRAALARRFGQSLTLRLDQAFGQIPEPVAPDNPPPVFAVRLTLPEPIGLEQDVAAGLDRLLPELARRLADKGRGARAVRLQALRCDHTRDGVTVRLARPSAQPDRIRPLLKMKLAEIDAGPGIDVLRLEAIQTEPVHAHQHRGHLNAAQDATRNVAQSAAQNGPGNDQSHSRAGAQQTAAIDDLLGRIGARVGLDQVRRLHPGDSHIPEKTTKVLAAAWSEPATDWPTRPPAPRPLTLFRPEPVHVPPETPGPGLPARFRWRRRDLTLAAATGPERIAPEWWLDEPQWRSGVRDYWRVQTGQGDRLWLYYAHGGAMSGGWFCQGVFA